MPTFTHDGKSYTFVIYSPTSISGVEPIWSILPSPESHELLGSRQKPDVLTDEWLSEELVRLFSQRSGYSMHEQLMPVPDAQLLLLFHVTQDSEGKELTRLVGKVDVGRDTATRTLMVMNLIHVCPFDPMLRAMWFYAKVLYQIEARLLIAAPLDQLMTSTSYPIIGIELSPYHTGDIRYARIVSSGRRSSLTAFLITEN